MERQSVIAEVDPAFREDVLKGLGMKPRAIPARWLYDRRGSELFETITALPEYYPTRTERSILSYAVGEIAVLIGPKRAVVEFGSGSSTKTPILLSEVSPAAYVPIDISAEFLRESVAALSIAFPDLPIFPIEGDFTGMLGLPEAIDGMAHLGFFPGSTIGNLLVSDAVDLLRVMAATLGAGSMLLIGIDRIKDANILLPAYDDAQGVTAAFNLNLLHRINRELSGTVPVDAFSHVVRWNDVEARIEMHLMAVRDVHFSVDGRIFSMAGGETIHTENSVKYDGLGARVLLRAGGWTPIADWTDQRKFFSLILAKAGIATSSASYQANNRAKSWRPPTAPAACRLYLDMNGSSEGLIGRKCNRDLSLVTNGCNIERVLSLQKGSNKGQSHESADCYHIPRPTR
jgi:dimethylhistidine N-methyltransferase